MRSLSTIQSVIICSLVVLLPLFFLPITSDFFNFNKLALLVGLSLLSLLVWGLGKIKSRHFIYRTSILDVPVFLFALAVLVSAFVSSSNKLNSFVFPGVATGLVGSILFYFLLVQYIAGGEEGTLPKRISKIVTLWIWGVVTASLVTLLSGLGIFEMAGKNIPLPELIRGTTFSPVGTILLSVLLGFVTLPLLFGRAMRALSRTEQEGGIGVDSIFSLLGFIALVGSLAMGIYQLLPGKPAAFVNLPLSSGWVIALEVLKAPLSFLFGVGPGNFIEAFSKYRPVAYNLSPYWNAAFGSSTNWYLDLLTTSGVVTFGLFLLLLARLKKAFRQVSRYGDMPYVKISLLVALAVFLVYSPGLPFLFAFFMLLALVGAYTSKAVRFDFSVLGEQLAGSEGVRGVNMLALLVSIIAIGGLIGTGIWGGKVYAADMAYRRALNTVATQGKYKDIMDNMAQAITLNPRVDFYRTDYSQIMLALMQEIASRKDLSDSDKNDISQLVQRSIEQGKAGVALNQNRASNWTNLASIYRTLLPLVQGADQFAASVYQQAISLDPMNPNLRIAQGSLFYSLKDYDSAIKAFELSVAAKPDLANAHYNLAVALREAGKTDRAAQEMQTALNLVKPGSADYDLAKKDLDALQAILKAQASDSARPTATSGEEQAPLTAPQPAPSPIVTPKLSLPQSAQPPQASSSAQSQ